MKGMGTGLEKMEAVVPGSGELLESPCLPWIWPVLLISSFFIPWTTEARSIEPWIGSTLMTVDIFLTCFPSWFSSWIIFWKINFSYVRNGKLLVIFLSPRMIHISPQKVCDQERFQRDCSNYLFLVIQSSWRLTEQDKNTAWEFSDLNLSSLFSLIYVWESLWE